jgi:hypothetical protein
MVNCCPRLPAKNMCALFSKIAGDTPQDPLAFRFYSPSVSTDRLMSGIDNIRFDVSLSPKFTAFCRDYVLQLLVKHSDAAELLHNSPGAPKPAARKEFRELLQDLLIAVLNRANAEKKPQMEILAQAAIMKFLTLELQSQCSAVIAQGREKLQLWQRPGQEHNPRGHQIQVKLSEFQTNKKIIFRRMGRELGDLIVEVLGDAVRKTREAFFGAESSEPHAIFSNPLIFTTEDGKNDYVNLESYVTLGNFQKDPDYFEVVDSHVRAFLEWADSDSEESREYHSRQEACADVSAQIEELKKRQEETAPKRSFFSRQARMPEPLLPEQAAQRIAELDARLSREMEVFRGVSESYAARLDEMIAAPENALLLVDRLQSEFRLIAARQGGASQAEIAALEAAIARQDRNLDWLYTHFFEAGLIPYILAAYETAKICQDLCPPINPQQLKEALVDSVARKKVMHLLAEYRLPAGAAGTVDRSARTVREAGESESRAALIRFLRDYMRYQHDLRKFRLFQKLLDQIHYPLDARQRELSEINHTLYEFLLPEESKEPKKGKVTGHVIMKADIRDSTSITAQLLARELNPASYFSLNFFDPVHKLMPRYGASKVFLEGDAIILSIMETEGNSDDAYSVARACCLARDMIEGVRGVNDRATKQNLPAIELGIGICYQASAPMYLMDGERPIMISKALNESDRLSGCGKLAKQLLSQRNRFFNIFIMQTLQNGEGDGSPEEFLLHYNVEGIEINQLAFEKLTQEISMSKLELKFPLFGEPEIVELFCGTLPVAGGFQKLVVRQGRVPQIHSKDLRVLEYTDRLYWEVCSSRPLYEYVSRQLGW